MLKRSTKALFYSVAGPLMWANSKIYYALRAPLASESARVHLGPGQAKYIPGWINVDANKFTGKCDVWADLRNPLPFKSSSISAFYSHHVIEHLSSLEFHFRDVYRCLVPGGTYRVAGPSGDSAIKKFMENDLGWFSDWPDNRASIGGRLENFIMCRGEHVTILTSSFLRELLSNVGFKEVTDCLPVKTSTVPGVFQDCMAMEHESDFRFPHTLVLEAKK